MDGPLRAGVLEKVKTNGDVIRYDPVTDEFGVKTRGGFVRTYFRPQQGRSYFDAQ
jgi:filamentous hemagglutinin